MKSFKSFDEPLFRTAPDDKWLLLLDTGYQYGIEIVEPLGGSRSQGERTAVFLGYYLQEDSKRRSQCVVKLGLTDAIKRDYQGWQDFARCQPNRDSFASMSPPLEASFGAAVVTDLVGSAELPMESLAVARERGFEFLVPAIERLVKGTLAPLHEFRCGPGGITPHVRQSQADVLRGWLDPALAQAAVDKLDFSRLADIWRMPEVGNPGRRLKNLLPGLLGGEGLETDGLPVRLPLGAVHGDPNLDNVYVAHTPAELLTLAMIDFEWCRCGERDSPYDDLARLECELLLGQDLSRREELVAALVLGDVWLRDGAPLAASEEPDRSVFEAVRVLRKQAAILAGANDEEAELEFQRGYLATLLGQAIRYLGYDTPRAESRADALNLCQMLAARIAQPLALSPLPAFATAPIAHASGGGQVVVVGEGYRLNARSTGAYASLVLADPYPPADFIVHCELDVEELARGGWLALSTGVKPATPENSGLVARIRSDGPDQGNTIIYSHRNSRDSGARNDFEANWSKVSQLTLRLSVEGNTLAFVASEAGKELSITQLVIPTAEYRGPLALVAYSAAVRVRSLEVTLGFL